MLIGHNTNVTVGEITYHVQTEDRGTTNALIDTTVYFHGRVLHRLTNNYFDLLPLDPDREHALKLRLDSQHRGVLAEIRKGELNLPLPPEAEFSAASTGASDSASDSKVLLLELINAKSWLAGKRATLQVSVRTKENGDAVEHARVAARIEGAAEAHEFATETNIAGRAQLAFEMPRLTRAEPALVIEASHGIAEGYLRFHLRTKPRPPSAS
jgi:hypothetical protein